MEYKEIDSHVTVLDPSAAVERIHVASILTEVSASDTCSLCIG
jgi:hypothetical protein